MCGIFGGISQLGVDSNLISQLARRASQRGRDSSGYFWWNKDHYEIVRSDLPILKTLASCPVGSTKVFFGHSRLITHGQEDNQPVQSGEILVIHNGIVLNAEELWGFLGKKPKLKIDSEIIPALAGHFLREGFSLEEVPQLILSKCIGVTSAVLMLPNLGKISAFSNNGSLYAGYVGENSIYFSSERFPLEEIECDSIEQIHEAVTLDIPASINSIERNFNFSRPSLIPHLAKKNSQSRLLEYAELDLLRCNRCVLPSTMPFIEFDELGICNYCANYVKRNSPKPPEMFEEILSDHRRAGKQDCIIPFSGGRDSSFGLHLAVKRFGLNPIAYTYDWGMVTDVGRRNISRMCAELGVENIVVAADIAWKRNNIRKNLKAWLKEPELGMLSILTAGDKHFFRHVDTIRKQTGISLNVWSVNPLEVTHFKAGFLGVPPDFKEKNVYQSGISKQIRYQKLRFQSMLRSPGYFNSSLFDTLSGEYFRSVSAKTDYYHLFDYWRWDENEIDECLDTYNWERATDTSTSWRIGDGTAAFYNYVYHRVAGFSEHDTFRSNQIREGDITRAEALELIQIENLPRYENINWYLEVLGMPFEEVIKSVNRIPRLESR